MSKSVIGRSLALLSLVTSLLWLGATSSQATGEGWSVTGVNTTGCESHDWILAIETRGLDTDPYTFHTVVTAGDRTYVNEDDTTNAVYSNDLWSLATTFSYGAVSKPGTYPMTPGQQMKVQLLLERPKGTVLSSWTMVAKSCDSPTLLYNGPTSADLDEDLLATPTDKCPGLKAFTANGCPLRDRALTLRARYGPKRVVGRLYAAGYPALYVGRTVAIWKVRPGPDRKIARRTTDSLGRFKARVGKGRYYATAQGLIVPTTGQVAATTSPIVRLH